MEPVTFAKLEPKIVLGVAAHPDDLDFYASATFAKYIAAGAQVHYLILTNGDKGSSDPAITSQALVALRRQEQQAAADTIGVSSVTFLEYPDGLLEANQQVKADVVKAICEIKPDVVVTIDPAMLYVPERGFINHPDHRAAGQATLDAVYPLARDHLSLPELRKQGYHEHIVTTVLLINLANTNYDEDVSQTLDVKFEALAKHQSQIADMDAVCQHFTKLASKAGAKCGCKYAESFLRIDLEPSLNL